MAMMVSPEVAKLFQVLTGEEFPDADEDKLRALAQAWSTAAQRIGGELGPQLQQAVATIRSNFSGQAEQAFVDRMEPFVHGGNGLLNAAADQFNQLAKVLNDLALDVEYMKLVVIYSLIALLAEIALAIALAPWTGGASMAKLAVQFAITRFFIRTVIGRVIRQIVELAVVSLAFQLLIDVAAQLTQYGMGTRDSWNTDHTKNAAAVGGMGAALGIPFAGLNKLIGNLFGKGLGKLFGDGITKQMRKEIADIVADTTTESLHEMLTEALYKYATEGTFELNPFAGTAGAASGAGTSAGGAFGKHMWGDGSDSGGGGGARGGSDSDGPSGETGQTGNSTGPGGSDGTGATADAGSGPGGSGATGGGSGSGSGGGAGGGAGEGGPPGGDSGSGGTQGGESRGGPGNSAGGSGSGGSGSGGNSASGNGSNGSGAGGNSSTGNGQGGSSSGGGGSGSGGSGGTGSSGNGSAGTGAGGNGSSGSSSSGGGSSGNAGGDADSGSGNSGSGNGSPGGGAQSGGAVGDGPRNGGGPQGGNTSSGGGLGDGSAVVDQTRTGPGGNAGGIQSGGSQSGGSQSVGSQNGGSPGGNSGGSQSGGSQHGGSLGGASGGQQTGGSQTGGHQGGESPTGGQQSGGGSGNGASRGGVGHDGPPSLGELTRTGTGGDNNGGLSGGGAPHGSTGLGQDTSTGNGVDFGGQQDTRAESPSSSGVGDGAEYVNPSEQHGDSAKSDVDGQRSDSRLPDTNSRPDTSTLAWSPSPDVVDPAGRESLRSSDQHDNGGGLQSGSTQPPTQSNTGGGTNAMSVPPPVGGPDGAGSHQPGTSSPATQSSSNTNQAAPRSGLPATTAETTAVHQPPPSRANPSRPGSKRPTVPTARSTTSAPQMPTPHRAPQPAEAAEALASAGEEPAGVESTVESHELATLPPPVPDNRGNQPDIENSPVTANQGNTDPAAITNETIERAAAAAAAANAAVHDVRTGAERARYSARRVEVDLAAIDRAARGADSAVVATEAARDAADQNVRVAQGQFDEVHARTEELRAMRQRMLRWQQQRAAAKRNQRDNRLDPIAEEQAAKETTRQPDPVRQDGNTALDRLQRDIDAATAVEQAAGQQLDTARHLRDHHQRIVDSAHAGVTAVGQARDRAQGAQDTARAAADAIDLRVADAQRAADAAADAAGRVEDAANAAAAANATAAHRRQIAEELTTAVDELTDLRTEVLGKDEPNANQLAEIDAAITDTTAAAERANGQADTANQTAAAAERTATDSANDAEAARDTAQQVVTETTPDRTATDNAVTESDAAKDAATTAADANTVERRLAQLSTRPDRIELTVEHIGRLDDLVDAIGAATGQPQTDQSRADIRDQLTTENLTTALTDGSITVRTPDGPVDVTVDLYRPASDQHGGPTVSTSTGNDSGTPLTESVSSSVPLRIPIFAAITAGVDAFRPVAYVGATSKRSQTAGSSTTFSTSTGNPDRVSVNATVVATATAPGNAPVVSTFDTTVSLPDVTPERGTPTVVPGNTAGAWGNNPVRTGPVTVPETFTSTFGDANNGLPDSLQQLLVNPGDGTVHNGTIDVTTNGPLTATLIDSTSTSTSSGTSHTGSSGISRGSDANVGGGFYGGAPVTGGQLHGGGSVDLSSGLTDGSKPAVDRGVSHSATNTDLSYEIHRPVRATGTPDAHGNTPTADGTASTTVQVSVPTARALGLPLPPHLSGSTPTRGPDAPYQHGRNDIAGIPGRDGIVDLVVAGHDGAGRDAVQQHYTGDKGKAAVYNALYGGDQIVWTKDGVTHVLDVYGSIVPPATTEPSGQTKATVEDKAGIQRRRAVTTNRGAKLTTGLEFRPDGKDNGAVAAATAPAGQGDPNPYQGASTSSGGAPRFVPFAGGVDFSRGISTGVNGKDARASAFDGDFRGFDGDLRLVVAHREITNPNWAQNLFLGGMRTFGPAADARLTEPSKADIDTALSTGDVGPDPQRLRTGTVPGAVRMSVPADRFDHHGQTPPSTMDPGIYVGTPPPRPTNQINPLSFGEYASAEHVRVTSNTTEGVQIAMSKRMQPADGSTPDGSVTRRPPKGSGMWPSWGKRQFTDTRGGDSSAGTTTYDYKLNPLTRPGTTSGDTVQELVGEAGSRGSAVLNLGGEPSSAKGLVQPGRLTDLNGNLEAGAEYYAPRLVDVRPNGSLSRNQIGDRVVTNTSGRDLGLESEVSLGALPRRDGRAGSQVQVSLGGGGGRGKSNSDELTVGGKQSFEYTGPTAFVAVDVRYTYEAQLNFRNMLKTVGFPDLPVTVDQPDGLLVEMPTADAAKLFRDLGLPVPPELAGAVPDAPTTPRPPPAQTLLVGPDGYVSYGDTTVIDSSLTNPDQVRGLVTELTNLGVSGEALDDIVDQVRELLGNPRGRIRLKDVLGGSAALLQTPNGGPFYDEVVEVRVRLAAPPTDGTGAPAEPKQPSGPVPHSQTTSGYSGRSTITQHSRSSKLSLGLQGGGLHRTTPPTAAPEPGSTGTPKQDPGAKAGSFGLLGQLGRSWKRQWFDPTSGSHKTSTQVKFDKIGRSGNDVTYELSLAVRKVPMPGFNTPLLGLPSLVDVSRVAPNPVYLDGSVDLTAPTAAVAPPLTSPSSPPKIEVVDARPDQTKVLSDKGGWRVEALGSGTQQAIHDALFTLMSNQRLGTGEVTADQLADAENHPSDYTRKGGAAEYALHGMAAGTSLHNGGFTQFSSRDYAAHNLLGDKHVPADTVADVIISGDFRPDTFRLVGPNPDDATVDLTHEVEDGTPHGETITTTTTGGVTTQGSGSTTAGANPATAGSSPTAGASGSSDATSATAGRTSASNSTKYTGRSYLFTVDADFYVEANRHWSNRVADFVADTWNSLRGTPKPRVMHIESVEDIRVRVWEGPALRDGLLTIGDVWRHQSKTPGDGLAVSSTPDGAVIHRQGDDAPAPPPRETPAPPASRGRTVHIGPGVSAEQVRSFVDSLPKDMRPADYTVDPAAGFGPADVRGLAVPRPNQDTTGQTPPPVLDKGKGPETPGHIDELGAPWHPATDHPAEQHAEPGERHTAAVGKRTRAEFEADDGPVTTPEPPRQRPVPETLLAPSAAETAALSAVAPPGTRFSDPATFVGLINGARSAAGRDVNCVDAALAFHETFHGRPRVAGIAADGVPRGGGTRAAEALSYAPELMSGGLTEVIERIQRAGHGADAILFGYPIRGRGHGWNVVNHHGTVSIVDAQAGTSTAATADAIPGLDRVYAIPLDADGAFVTGESPAPPVPPADPADAYAAAAYERAADVHRMRTAVATGGDVPVRGTNARLVQDIGGLRLVGAVVTAELAADLAAVLDRKVIAMVIGPDAEPRPTVFPPRGRPLPATR